jgi:hypothetical protein
MNLIFVAIFLLRYEEFVVSLGLKPLMEKRIWRLMIVNKKKTDVYVMIAGK